MHKNIPIFDSLTHPTLSGNWFKIRNKSSFEFLKNEILQQKFIGACAVGISGLEKYNHKLFIEKCKTIPKIYPVAGFNPNTIDISKELREIKKLGYKGIKIHPRFNKIKLNGSNILETFKIAEKENLIVFLCTFFSTNIIEMPISDPFWDLVKLIKEAPELKIILLHGGVQELMKYAELVRFNDNLLLDISYTMIRYKNSSLRYDIDYLFKHLDQKICIGSDFPEYSLSDLRKTFNYYSDKISRKKSENIAYKNIIAFLNI